MQATYKMIGADGAEYGPVGLTDFRNWITEGRVDGLTHVQRSDSEAWTTASNLPELGLGTRSAANPASAASTLDPDDAAELEKKIKTHGSWFYWIAALTFLNSLAAFFGSEWGFYLGVSALQALDFAASQAPVAVRAVVLSVDLSVALAIASLGYVATQKKSAWPFAVGATFYGLDTLLNALALAFGGSPIGLALHIWALVCLVLGFKAARQWRQAALPQ